MAEKRHCLFYEWGLLEGTESDQMDVNLIKLANDWVFENGKYQTLFLGVSLGELFSTGTSHCLGNYLRLERSLRKLIERFRPEEILPWTGRFRPWKE